MKNKPTLLIQAVIAIFFLISTLPATSNTQTSFNTLSTGDPYLRLNEINIHAARDFKKRFSQITTDKWLKLDNGYLVKFTRQGIKSQVFYNDNGQFILQTRYYTEDNMPAEVKTTLQQRFAGYSIVAVTEVLYENEGYFRINIKNNHSVKTVRIVNTSIEILEDWENGEMQQ